MPRVIRSWPIALFLLFLVLSALLVVPLVMLFSWIVLSECYLDWLVLSVMLVLSAIYAIPLIILICHSIYHFTKGIAITADGITCFTLFKKYVIRMERISAWGTITFTPRSTRIFLCADTRTRIHEFYEVHQADCQKIFGADKFKQLSQSEDGKWILELAIYLFYKPSDVFFLDYSNQKRVRNLTDLLRIPPLFINTLKE